MDIHRSGISDIFISPNLIQKLLSGKHMIGRGRKEVQKLQLLGVLLGHVVQLVLQHTLDAVGGAQHLSDDAGFQGRVNDAVSAGVDHRRRPTGLTDDTGTL